MVHNDGATQQDRASPARRLSDGRLPHPCRCRNPGRHPHRFLRRAEIM